MIKNAGVNFYLESVREFSDPSRGDGIEHVYGGKEWALRSLADDYRNNGIAAELTLSGIKWTLSVYYASRSEYDGSEEDPSEEWETDANFIELSLFENGNIYTAIAGELVVGETVRGIVSQMKSANDEKDKTARETKEALFLTYPSSGLERPNITKIYNMFVDGVESFPISQPLVRQNRYTSYLYAQPYVIDPTPNAYINATFFAGFAVPAFIQAKLPTQATLNTLNKPADTTWAWFQHSHTSTTELRTQKVRETREWVLGTVSDVIYTIT